MSNYNKALLTCQKYLLNLLVINYSIKYESENIQSRQFDLKYEGDKTNNQLDPDCQNLAEPVANLSLSC